MIGNLPKSITEKTASSVKWSALMEVVSRTASPIVFVILARLLTPEDFGVMATAMIAISFTQLFWEGGLGKALVHTQEPYEKAADVVFWSNLVISFAIYTLLFLMAPWVARFLHSPMSSPVLRVLGLQVIINALTSAQQALLIRDLGFRQLFRVRLATALAPGAFAIPMAIYGYGIWSLVAGSLAGSLLNLSLLWVKSAWRPSRVIDWRIAQKVFKFASWTIAESVTSWFIEMGDNLLVGAFIGVKELGVYSMGWNISAIIFSLLLNPLFQVLYPSFSRLQDDLPTLKETFHKANRVIIFLALPAGTGLLLVGPQLVTVLFGDKWQGLGQVLSIIGFMHGMTWLVGINSELYRAAGRPDANPKLMFLAILYYLPAYLAAAPFGLEVFTLARLGVTLVAIPIHVYVCVRIFGMSPFYLWYDSKTSILATLVMAGGIVGLEPLLSSHLNSSAPLVLLVVLIGMGVIIYGVTLWLLDRSFVLQMKNLIKKVAFP